jgi:hypothetical protein
MNNWWKTDDEAEQSFHTFYYVTVDTLYGELDLIVGANQLEEEQKPLLKEGALIFGIFTLSGDVVLDEFEDGAVYNEECCLRLIRQGLVKGETDRCLSAFGEKSAFEFSEEKIEVNGIKEVFNQFEKYQKSKERFITSLASASVVFDDGSVDYTSRKRCIAVSYGNEIAEHLVFIDTDENGKIARLKIVSALGFEVKMDRPEYEYDEDLYGVEGFSDMN